MAEAAGTVDGAQQAHQDAQRPGRLKSVGMSRQPPHGVEGHRRPGDGFMVLAPGVGPGDGKFNGLVAGRDAHFVGQLADVLGRDAADAFGPFRRVLLDLLLEQLERGLDRGAVVEGVGTQQAGLGVGPAVVDRLVAGGIPPQLVLRIDAAFPDRQVGAHKKAELLAFRILVHELRAVGVGDQEIPVIKPQSDDLADDGQQQGSVGAGLDRYPVVGDGGVTGAHRVDGDETSALAFEFAQRLFQGIRVMIFGRADHHEQFGPFQVGAAELPERAADGVDHSGRHVDRAETAVGGIIGGAELFGEETGQRLHLVPPGKERQLPGIGGANAGQALFEYGEGLVPGDGDEIAGTALAALPAFQRAEQAGRGILLHDARGPLGADHALVQGMLGVALDIANLAVPEVNPDAAAAGAHIASRGLDFGLAGFAIAMAFW